MKKYKLITVPSSDDEKEFENAGSFDEAAEIIKNKDTIAGEFAFDTEKEREIFIEGYMHAIGYLGQGLHFVKNEL